MSSLMRRGARGRARVGAAGGLAILAFAGLSGQAPVLPGLVLQAGSNFTITSSVTVAPGCTVAALLGPGSPARCFTYTVTNPLAAPITVTTMSIASITAPAGCAATNLDTSNTTFSGFLTVPANGGTASTPANALSLRLLESAQNQNGCKSVTFSFTYAGTARYTDSTSTGLVSSAPGGANAGQPVTYTATVTPAVNPAPGAVAGSVTFYDGSTPITCNSPTFSSSTSGDVATCSVTYGSPGTHFISAVFTPSDSTSFSGSTSNVVTQVVNQNQQVGNCSGSTAGATVVTGTYNGNYEVKNGQTVWLNGGTIKGNVQVDATGQFTATNGTVTGNLQSSGGPVSMVGTTVGGNVQGTNATIGIGPGTKVGGNVQPNGGGSVCMQGTAGNPVQVTGNVQIQSLPVVSTLNTICALNIGGNLQIQNNGSPIQVGGSSSCTGNTISGNLQVQNNTAAVTIGGAGTGLGNTTTKGNIQVQGNTGGGTLTNNSAGGNCQLSGDNPKITGSANAAKGTNTCNGAG